MLYRPELTAHRGGCSNAQLLQARVPLGSPWPAKVRLVNSGTKAEMSTMAEIYQTCGTGLRINRNVTYRITLCEEIPSNRSTMRSKRPVHAESPVFHWRAPSLYQRSLSGYRKAQRSAGARKPAARIAPSRNPGRPLPASTPLRLYALMPPASASRPGLWLARLGARPYRAIMR
jgi:hypothetical protein